MAYNVDKWTTVNHVEYEYKYAGNYGAKGEKRCQKVKATPEQIKKQNQQNRERKLLRLIRANFFLEDLWITLKYPAGTRKPLEEIKKDFKKFTDQMRKIYKARGQIFKYVYRMEIGSRGGIHIHILINRLEEHDTDLVAKKAWVGNRMQWENVYESGGFERLADYIVKQPNRQMEGQLSFFSEEERKVLVAYNSSRNLIRPEPERKVYQHWTMRKILNDGPKPAPGFYIDPDSIHRGVNRFTGMSYLRYTECRLRPIESRAEWRRWIESRGRDG